MNFGFNLFSIMNIGFGWGFSLFVLAAFLNGLLEEVEEKSLPESKNFSERSVGDWVEQIFFSIILALFASIIYVVLKFIAVGFFQVLLIMWDLVIEPFFIFLGMILTDIYKYKSN